MIIYKNEIKRIANTSQIFTFRSGSVVKDKANIRFLLGILINLPFCTHLSELMARNILDTIKITFAKFAKFKNARGN